jgi:hypothetical protein
VLPRAAHPRPSLISPPAEEQHFRSIQWATTRIQIRNDQAKGRRERSISIQAICPETGDADKKAKRDAGGPRGRDERPDKKK